MCTGNSLMADFCLLKQKAAASFRGELNLIRPGTAVGMCLGSPTGATLNFVSLVFWFQLVIMKWVPPHRSLWPTNQRRTLLGWVLVSSLQNCFAFICCYWWPSICISLLFWDICKENLFLYNSRQQSEAFCGLCQAGKILTQTIWSSWDCSVEPGNSLKTRHPVKSLLAKSGILTLKKYHPENKQTGNCVFWTVIDLLSLAWWGTWV